MASEEIDPRPGKYWPSVESLKAYGLKNLQATLLFVDFTKAFNSIHRGKMEQILLAYGLPKETAAARTILYRNTKVKVRSPDGDTEYFDIVARVLQTPHMEYYRRQTRIQGFPRQAAWIKVTNRLGPNRSQITQWPNVLQRACVCFCVCECVFVSFFFLDCAVKQATFVCIMKS